MDRCPGSGMTMVSRSYLIRQITDADREDNSCEIERCMERGDPELAEIVRDLFEEWEREQGQTKERLVCAVCGSWWLSPTSKGTARPHRRDDIGAPSWDRARQLREDIKVLQNELDRVLEALEP